MSGTLNDLKAPVTGDNSLSRNQRYEKDKKDRGLVKVTLWIPAGAAVELKQVAEFCCDNTECIPFMVRDTATGKMRKAV